MAGTSFFAELRRRKVFRAAAIYGAVAWGLTEVIVTIVEQLFLPAWVATLSVILFVVGFPVAMFLAWTFDITSEGIQRTEIGSRRGAMSIAGSMLLVIAGTAGLFLLIRPAMEQAHGVQSETKAPSNSVAVLPFENVSRREDDFYLSEGLSDELRDQLSQVQGMQIAARSSSIAVRNQRVGAAQMANTIGVAYLIEGSLKRNGPRLSISVQLIDGATGLAVWSDNYERGRLELLDVQQDIARQIVGIVFPDASATRVAAPATLNPTANELMLLARYYEQQVLSRQIVDTDVLLEAIRLYREATDADPESAIAQSRLAGTLLYLGDIEAAEIAIFRAVALDPNLSEVQNTLGKYYWARGLPEAIVAFRRAAELNPNNPDALENYAIVASISREEYKNADATQLYRRALKLDPLSFRRHIALGEHLGRQGYANEVPAVISNIQALFDDAESCRGIEWLYELIGEIDQSIAWTLRARNLEPDNQDHIERLADLYALIGDEETALLIEPDPSPGILLRLRRYQDVIDTAEFLMIDRPDDIEIRYLLALTYHLTGAHESAIRVLSSTGLPDTILNGMPRSTSEIEAFMTLTNALLASDSREANEAGRSLALWGEENGGWWGDIGWSSLYRSCNFAVLGESDAALELLPRLNESARLSPMHVLKDSWCFSPFVENPVYLNTVREQEQRRARLREKLPATLAESGVSL